MEAQLETLGKEHLCVVTAGQPTALFLCTFPVPLQCVDDASKAPYLQDAQLLRHLANDCDAQYGSVKLLEGNQTRVDVD